MRAKSEGNEKYFELKEKQSVNTFSKREKKMNIE